MIPMINQMQAKERIIAADVQQVSIDNLRKLNIS